MAKDKDKDKVFTEGNERARLQQRLESMADGLLKKRDEAVLFRAASGVERRWMEDQAAFDGLEAGVRGLSMIDYASGEAPPRGGSGLQRSRAQTNIVRSKVEVAEGRFCDIVLPVDDRNWGLKPTPVPTLVKGLTDDRQAVDTETMQLMTGDNGQPVRASDIAQSQMTMAKKRMEGMETAIDDQLTESSYNAECRKIIKSAARLGTGVLKGPSVVKSVRKAWMPSKDDPTVWVMQPSEQHAPATKALSVWNVYTNPECGEDVSRAAYIWEYDEVLPRELRALIGVEGYYEEQIEQILLEEPQRTNAGISNDHKRYVVEKKTIGQGSTYERWEYHGDVDKDDLAALGLDVEEFIGKTVTACCVFVNDRPIKIQLDVLDSGDIIYDFFQWTQVDGSPWGIGVSRASIWWDRIIRNVWRAILDNARDSSGANIVVANGVEPYDGKWEITGKKLWKMTGSMQADARMAFQQFQITNNQAELQAIIELALKFLDIETNLPMIFQGEQSEQVPDVLGIVDIMVDSSNVALRSRVKIWDDQVTRRHVKRYYDWNMQYGKDPEIKGDYQVDPRGASVLMARDEQIRALISLFKLRGDKNAEAEIDFAKSYRALCQLLRLDILKTEDQKKREQELRSQQPPEADPKTAVAQIRTEGEMAKAKLVQESDREEIRLKAELAQMEMRHQREMKIMDLQMKQMQFAQESGLSLAQIKADLAVEASKQSLQRELTDKKLKGPQIATPPVEPAGRADEGRAYAE